MARLGLLWGRLVKPSSIIKHVKVAKPPSFSGRKRLVVNGLRRDFPLAAKFARKIPSQNAIGTSIRRGKIFRIDYLTDACGKKPAACITFPIKRFFPKHYQEADLARPLAVKITRLDAEGKLCNQGDPNYGSAPLALVALVSFHNKRLNKSARVGYFVKTVDAEKMRF